ncbi:putative transposable element [Phytophthora palmivora]|uniref:Transposable element n=1 Tax=Phytophthora palmivora TaxID=4796 RepID=A0A2P4Y7M1_9STRA|nr:putative transposable element [Phytophthora palmivora]
MGVGSRPKGRKILSCRWVFVVKYTGTGEIDRFKARLVIKGFLQEYGIDYNEIFSPVIKMEVLRLLLTIAALFDLEIHQMDVKTAFLNGFKMKRSTWLNRKVSPLRPDLQTHKKSIRVEARSPCLVPNIIRLPGETRFSKLIKDSCVFIRAIDGVTYYIAVYVDDLLIIAPT